MSNIVIMRLLETDVWEAYADLLAGLQSWRHYVLFSQALSSLNVAALYKSHLHGQGHIERALLFSALLAWQDNLSFEDSNLLFLSASYHDVGRIDDKYDTEHGSRSAGRLKALTGQTGENLLLMQGAVAAHSRPDTQLEKTVAEYNPLDFPHAVELAQYLKDADGLDRVRIRDLNPDFLRHNSARSLVPFAQYLFNLYCKEGAATPAYWCPVKNQIITEGA